jgi:hypothetical protein
MRRFPKIRRGPVEYRKKMSVLIGSSSPTASLMKRAADSSAPVTWRLRPLGAANGVAGLQLAGELLSTDHLTLADNHQTATPSKG